MFYKFAINFLASVAGNLFLYTSYLGCDYGDDQVRERAEFREENSAREIYKIK